MANYRKKPVVIRAMQWDGSNVAELKDFFGAFHSWRFENTETVIIETISGEHRTEPSDWIIEGVTKGDFYPCKADIFAATYDAVAE